MSPAEQPMSHFVDALDDELARAGADLERRARRRTRRLRLATVAGVAAVVVATVGIGVRSDDGGGGVALGPVDLGPARAAAAERCRAPTSAAAGVRACLSALGAVAADWEAPGDGPVAYEQRWSIGATQHRREDGRRSGPFGGGPGGFTVAYPTTTDAWIAPSGAGQTTINPLGRPLLPTARDRRRWRAAGSPSLGGAPPAGEVGVSGEGITTTTDGRIVERWGAGGAQDHALQVGDQGESGGPTLFDGRDPTTTLSRDPARLAVELRRLAWRQRVAISGDPCPRGFGRCPAPTEAAIASNVGTLATGLLAYPATPRPLRAALLRTLAGLRGARTLGPGRDPIGRRGTVVRLPDGVNDGQTLLLFDLTTARLLAQGTSRGTGAGDPLWGTLWAVRAAHVEHVGELPSRR